jgi:asparagine synthase (glutamine-hydrolysing)
LLLRTLKKALFAAVEQAVGSETSLAIAFSGGLDSSLLAKICKDIQVEVTLLTIGFTESYDISFSREIASKMGLPHKILKLDDECFESNVNHIRNKIKCNIISHLENCVGFFYIGKFAHANGFRSVLTANGCDELFCGYDRFRLVYNQGSATLMKFMDEKLENEFVLMQEIDSITREFGIKIKQPFLSPDFISLAKNIPIDQKINGPNDLFRKHILREVAVSMNVPNQSAMQRKKALQYSSGIHKNFCKVYRE